MKFSFKRFLGSALAAVMTVSVLSVGMVSSVSAATNTYLIPTGLSMPSKNGDTVVLTQPEDKYEISYTRGGSGDAFTTLSTAVEFEGASYKTAITTGSNDKGCLVIKNVNEGDKITVVYGNINKDANTFTISDKYNSTNYAASSTPTTDNNVSSQANPSTGKGTTKLTHEALANGTYYAGYTVSKGDIYAIIIEEAGPAGTNTISGNVTYTKEAPKGKFMCGTHSFNVVGNAYSVTGLAAGTYEITYTGDDYTMEPVTVTIPDGSDKQTFNQDLTLEEIIHYTGTVEVNPTVTGNKTVYDFTTAKGDKLVSENTSDKSETTAYSKSKATDDLCWVELSHEGAKLMDNSGDGTSGESVELVIPYAPKTNKITVSGEVTPKNAVGSKWKLIDLGVVALLADTNTNAAIGNDSNTEYGTNAGKVTKDSKITYSITLDLEAKTASGTVTNGTIGSAEFKDVAFAENANFNSIVSITNGKESITTGKDRALLIPSVTIIDGEEEVSPVTVGSTTVDGTTYVFAGVAEGHEIDGNELIVYGSSTATTADEIKNTNNVVFNTDKVYSSVEDIDKPEGVNGNVFACIVTSTSKNPVNLVAVLGEDVSAVGKVEFAQ